MSRYVFDIETNGLLDTLTKIHSLVLKNIDTGEIRSFQNDGTYDSIVEGVRVLQEAALTVGHNVIKFDIPALQKIYPWFKPKGIVKDTLVQSRLLKADIKDEDFRRNEKAEKLRKPPPIPRKMIGRHSLESWGYRLGNWKGDYAEEMTKEAKELGLKDKDEIVKYVWGTWSQKMQDYCVQDCHVTLDLYNHFQTILAEGWGESEELEHEVAWIIARQERFGFAFDEAKAAKLYAALVSHKERLTDSLQETFPPTRKEFVPKANNRKYGYTKGVPVIRLIPFNPGSRQQVAKRLQEIGWEPDEYGKDGIPKVDDEILQGLPYKEAKVLAELFMVDKRIGQLATGKEAWLKAVRNGRIYGEVITNGAVTGRMTHRHPNVAQVPGEINKKTGDKQPYGHECRDLFCASPNMKLAGADADALELRLLAGYMARYDGGEYIKTVLEGDKALGTDMHSVNARALGSSSVVVHREIAKKWFYAFIYGAQGYKLGTILGIKGGKRKIMLAGKKSSERFLKNLPALGALISAVQGRVHKQGYLLGLDGRRLHIRAMHAALNTLLQSAGAIVMKRALVILDKSLQSMGFVPGVDYEFVANIHDEWQIDTKEELAKQVGEEAIAAIKAAGEYYSFRCPLAGNYEIGNTWAETH